MGCENNTFIIPSWPQIWTGNWRHGPTERDVVRRAALSFPWSTLSILRVFSQGRGLMCDHWLGALPGTCWNDWYAQPCDRLRGRSLKLVMISKWMGVGGWGGDGEDAVSSFQQKTWKLCWNNWFRLPCKDMRHTVHAQSVCSGSDWNTRGWINSQHRETPRRACLPCAHSPVHYWGPLASPLSPLDLPTAWALSLGC